MPKDIFSVLAGLVWAVGFAVGPVSDCKCPAMLKEARTKLKVLTREGRITRETIRQVDDLISKATTLHQQKKHFEAVAGLEKALKLLHGVPKGKPKRPL